MIIVKTCNSEKYNGTFENIVMIFLTKTFRKLISSLNNSIDIPLNKLNRIFKKFQRLNELLLGKNVQYLLDF